MSLAKVYNYWFENNTDNLLRHWIPITPSKAIQKISDIELRFGHIYYKCLFVMLNIQKQDYTDIYKYSYRQQISLIILLDQFTRSLGKKYPNLHRIRKLCSQLCIPIVNNIVDNADISEFKPNELLFLFMIYKHIDINQFPIIHNKITEYCEYHKITLISPEMKHLQRFYIDFYTKYIDSNFPNKEEMNISMNSEYKITNNDDYKGICDIDGFLPSNYENLEYDLLRMRLCHTNLDMDVQNVLSGKVTGDICVSLSGGVDSMVLSYILKGLERDLNIRVSAFHISYNNREESQYEKCLIWNFCNKLEIPLFNYNIEYIKRGNINRDDYEKITREIRFRCYRTLGCPIVLGHIREDKIENIITNFSTNQHMFDLAKIHLFNKIDGVTIVRPFINNDKTEIVEYSHLNNIPYLNNTTPLWSNRGKFRNDFIPAFIKQYGDASSVNLERFADTLHNYGEIIEDMIISPNVEKLSNGEFITITDKLRKNIHLIKEIFKRYCHDRDFNSPSEKSIKNLLIMLSHKKISRYELNKNVRLELCDNKVRCI